MNIPDFWTEQLLECNRLDFTPPDLTGSAVTEQGGPTLSSRSFAIALRAMAHAWFLNGNTVSSFGFPAVPAPPAGADPGSALHGAAQRILSRLFTNQSARILNIATTTPPSHGPSAHWGEEVADIHFSDRSTDGSSMTMPYVYSDTPGAFQPDPENVPSSVFAPMPPPQPHGKHYGMVRPWGITTMLPLDEPPGYISQGSIDRSDPAYVADLKKVRDLGNKWNREDTSNQKELDFALRGMFWAYDGVAHLGTPPRLYFQIIIKLAKELALTDGRKMVLYAICGTALGDAGIHAWFYKYQYNIWRPVTGIRHHDESMGTQPTAPQPSNKAVEGDPFWTPLGAPKTNGIGKNFTPPFPAYPSGHATFGGASLHALRKVLNEWLPQKVKLQGRSDKLGFTFVSDELNGVNRDVVPHASIPGNIRTRHERQFNSVEDAIVENGLSRVYLGVHWQFDAEPITPVHGKVIGGVPLGINIAEELVKKYSAAVAAV